MVVVSPDTETFQPNLTEMEEKITQKTKAVIINSPLGLARISMLRSADVYKRQPKNVGMCRYMNANVAGIHVPEYMIDELKADKEKTKAGITGVEIAARIIRECKPYCQGVHIMALGWESKVPEVLRLAGL